MFYVPTIFGSNHHGNISRYDANPAWIVSDSLVLVKAFKSTKCDHSLSGILLKESKFILSMQFAWVDVNCVLCSCNECAHEFFFFLTNGLPNHPFTTIEQDSVQVVVHATERMPHRPKVYDHRLALCNLIF